MTDTAVLLRNTKKEVHAVLLSSSRPLLAYEIERDYLRLVGHCLPYRPLGYTTSEGLLLDLRDTLSLSREAGRARFSAAHSEDTQHIAELVACNHPRVKQKPDVDVGGVFGRRFGGSSRPTDEQANKPVASFQLQQCIVQLLAQNPDGIPLKEFSDSFAGKFGFYPMGGENKFLDLEEVLKSVPHVGVITALDDKNEKQVVLSRSANTNEATCTDKIAAGSKKMDVLHSENLEMSSSSSGCSSGDSSADSDDLMDRKLLAAQLTDVLSSHPNGVRASKLPREFQKHTGSPLPLRSLGFLTVLDLISEVLKDNVRIVRPDPCGDWLLHVNKKNNDQTKYSSHVSTSANENIPLPAWLHPSQLYITVAVNHVVSPDHFYVCYVSGRRPVAETLQLLSRDMTKRYESSSKSSVVAEGEIVQGKACAVYSHTSNSWCRSVVRCITDHHLVQVEHVDYGTCDTVNMSSVFALHHRFLKLPRQCVRARLALVKPCGRSHNSSWSDEACFRFTQLVSASQVLQARVLSVDKEGVGDLLLCDTSTDVDIHINDTMVIEHLASHLS